MAGEVNPEDRLKCGLVGEFVGGEIRSADNLELSSHDRGRLFTVIPIGIMLRSLMR